MFLGYVANFFFRERQPQRRHVTQHGRRDLMRARCLLARVFPVVIQCLLGLLIATSAIAGTLVFPPPDGATQCRPYYVSNTCSTSVEFNGGSFIASQTGPTEYRGGLDFPYCTSATFGWNFHGANATQVTATIRREPGRSFSRSCPRDKNQVPPS